ncbi:nucleolar transcription factor 1-like [Tropilaelaps mercedesae]|uniref:Nucleolar transcription factor 1-like n=1 Tax=Tropilaelaps mercedesae TaxID=418985 RepID=A0A1V9XH88_9ACAR|nr:nucleolar transcription factor 1-like [Tropilaelaps mercedesae]
MEQALLLELRKNRVQPAPAAAGPAVAQSPAAAVGATVLSAPTMEARLDWSHIAFGKYSAIDCRSKWAELSQKVRQFRTLTELLADTQDLIKTSTSGMFTPIATPVRDRETRKPAKHPELPKKPLTPYMRQLWNMKNWPRPASPAPAATSSPPAASPADTNYVQNVITINLPMSAAPETSFVRFRCVVLPNSPIVAEMPPICFLPVPISIFPVCALLSIMRHGLPSRTWKLRFLGSDSQRTIPSACSRFQLLGCFACVESARRRLFVVVFGIVDKLKVVKERYPDMSHTEASKQITDKWHTLSDEKKQLLKTQFDLDMVDYQKKLERFFLDHPEANPNKSAAATAAAVAALNAAASNAPSAPAKSIPPKDEELAKPLPPMDLKTIEDRIREQVKANLDRISSASAPPADKPPNNGYALFARICQADLESLSLTVKEMMSEMVKRWQMLTDDHRKQLNESAKVIRTAYDAKFGHLNQNRANADKDGTVLVNPVPVPEGKKPRKTVQSIPIPTDKPTTEKHDPANDEITPLELYKKEKFARLKEDYPDKPDHELNHEDRLVWRERAKMVNEERREKDNPKGKEKDAKDRSKKTPRLPKRKPLPGEPKRPPMNDAHRTQTQLAHLVGLLLEEPIKFILSYLFTHIMSGYSVYTNEVMQRLRDTNQPKVLISVVAKQWTALPADQKAEYKAKAAGLNRAYKEQVASFLKTLSPEQVAEYKAHLEATSKRRGRRDQSRSDRRGLSEDSEDVEDEVVLSRDADEESQSESDMELRHSSAADCTSSEDESDGPDAKAPTAVAGTAPTPIEEAPSASGHSDGARKRKRRPGGVCRRGEGKQQFVG